MPEHILLVGINHKTAPVELREKLAFPKFKLQQAFGQLLAGRGDSNPLSEAVILSTCNRVEIYGVARQKEEARAFIQRFLCQFHEIELKYFESHIYFKTDLTTVEHLFAVASGINSMVVGENQIQHQVKEALEEALKYKASGPILSTLFRMALTVGKRARSETEISTHSLSVSQAAVNLVKRLFPDISSLKILLLGLGKMNLLAARSLIKMGSRQISIVNRTPEHALEFGRQYGIPVYGFDRMEGCLKSADVVISCTGAPHLILTRTQLEMIMQTRPHHPLTLIDIAVPRDVEPDVDKLENVQLFNIDQLQPQILANQEQRCREITRVREIINEEVASFLAWYHSLEVKPVITELRQRAEQIREQELQRALHRFEKNLTQHDVQLVEDLTRRIINKLLHHPIKSLRQEAEQGNSQLYAASLRRLFGLDETIESQKQVN